MAVAANSFHLIQRTEHAEVAHQNLSYLNIILCHYANRLYPMVLHSPVPAYKYRCLLLTASHCYPYSFTNPYTVMHVRTLFIHTFPSTFSFAQIPHQTNSGEHIYIHTHWWHSWCFQMKNFHFHFTETMIPVHAYYKRCIYYMCIFMLILLRFTKKTKTFIRRFLKMPRYFDLMFVFFKLIYYPIRIPNSSPSIITHSVNLTVGVFRSSKHSTRSGRKYKMLNTSDPFAFVLDICFSFFLSFFLIDVTLIFQMKTFYMAHREEFVDLDGLSNASMTMA